MAVARKSPCLKGKTQDLTPAVSEAQSLIKKHGHPPKQREWNKNGKNVDNKSKPT